MKNEKRCPKCDSMRVGHLAKQMERSGEFDRSVPRPLAVQTENEGRWPEGEVPWWGTQVYATTSGLVGQLEAYVCTACGYYETYVVEPSKIEWDKLVGFSMLNPEADPSGPFR